jgi:ribosomal protein S18 acetylase RimI-like enzyme
MGSPYGICPVDNESGKPVSFASYPQENSEVGNSLPPYDLGMNPPLFAPVRRIEPSEWQVLKRSRLLALQSDPDAFGSTFASEEAFTDAVWQERALLGASDPIQSTWVSRTATADLFDGMATLIAQQGADGEPKAVESTRELVGMWVAPQTRATGLASALLDTVIVHTTEHGITELKLWVMRPNERAQRLYLRHGFVPTGEVDVSPSNPCIEELRMVRNSNEMVPNPG